MLQDLEKTLRMNRTQIVALSRRVSELEDTVKQLTEERDSLNTMMDNATNPLFQEIMQMSIVKHLKLELNQLREEVARFKLRCSVSQEDWDALTEVNPPADLTKVTTMLEKLCAARMQ